jgi:hypothetical protein
VVLTRFEAICVGADNLLTQGADFDCPRATRLKSLRRAVLQPDEVGQCKSAPWGNSTSAPTPGNSPTGHGVIIGFLGWLIMMIIMVMPMAGVGIFGMAMGLMAPMMTLVLHLIFGTVLGWTYGKLLLNSTPRAGLR